MAGLSPLSFSSRDLQSTYPESFREGRTPQRYIHYDGTRTPISSMKTAQLEPREFAQLSPIWVGKRQGPYNVGKNKQSAFQSKIGSNRYLSIIYRLANTDEQKELRTNANVAAAAAGIEIIPDSFPPMKPNQEHLTEQLPVFIANFTNIRRVREIINRIEQELQRNLSDPDIASLAMLSTLSTRHKRRSAQTQTSRDNLRFYSLDKSGRPTYIPKSVLGTPNGLLDVDILALATSDPEELALVINGGKFNDRTVWRNNASAAAVRQAAKKIASINMEANYLKGQLLKQAERKIKECMAKQGGCTDRDVNEAFRLQDARKHLFTLLKAQRLGDLRSKLANVDLILKLRGPDQRAMQYRDDLIEKIQAVESSQLRTTKKSRKQQEQERAFRTDNAWFQAATKTINELAEGDSDALLRMLSSQGESGAAAAGSRRRRGSESGEPVARGNIG